MDFSLLPALAIEEVAAYLTLNDVIACSAVSRQWKKAFDCDQIWKRYSTFHKDYLKKQVSNQSQYCFDGCNAKKYVFQELQVGKRILEGKYDLVQVDIGRVYCDNLLDVVDDLGNHWLFISCAKNYAFESVHLIEVWNMNDKPIKHQSKETPLGVTKRVFDSQMKAYKNKFYYFENNIMIVFEFSHPGYSLTVLFKIDCPHIEGTRNHNAMVCKPNLVLALVFTDMHSHLSTIPWIHVWGNDGNTLLYKNYSTNDVNHIEAQIAESDESVAFATLPAYLRVKDGGSSNNVLFAYTFRGASLSSISVVLFNIKTFKHTTLFTQTNEGLITLDFKLDNQTIVVYYVLHGPIGITHAELSTRGRISGILVYSVDGNLIYKPDVRLNSSICNYISTANDGKTVLVWNEFGQIYVFDVFNKKEISAFRIPIRTREDKGSFNFVKDNFLIVQEVKKNKITLAVWDFKHGKRLYDFKLQEPASGYVFTFNKSYRSPPKIFGIKSPSHHYSRKCNGEIVMISFV